MTNGLIPAISCSTFSELLRTRAQHHPNRRAFTFLPDGETEQETLSYGELDQRARGIAAQIVAQHAPGARALLLYSPGLDFIAAFMGCLYAGVVAVPAYQPPPNNRPMPRLQAIVSDALASIGLTTASGLMALERRFDQMPELGGLHWLTTDRALAEQEQTWQEPVLSGDTLAFLQYTSGSTAAPKGVMVSHTNLLYNERMLQHAMGHTDESISVCWLPIFHDMGLIAHVLQSLYVGGHCVLMPPVTFLQRPIRWLQAIARYQAHTSGGPNFAYNLCVRKVTPEQRAALDLSSWRVASNGAEPIRQRTLDDFVDAFEVSGFRRAAFFPGYGLAEATVFVSGGPYEALPVTAHVRATDLGQDLVVPTAPGDDDAVALVGCGQTWLDEHIVIGDPVTGTICPPDRVGEVWISGPHVGQGYWNRPEETEQTFHAYLADTGEGPYLRTGDLGFMRDGELFISGRLKDLIIIRGRNYYPQDIEYTVEQCHPALRPGCGAAFSIEATDEDRLVLVYEVDRQWRNADLTEVVKAVRQAVVEHHELQVYDVVLIKAGGIPKTSSGKIQRQACRAGYLAHALDR